jgi:heptosyltransferase I
MLETPQRILIVKLGSIGDIVHTLPVLRTLRVRFPKAFIAWAVEEKLADLLYENPDLDEVIIISTKRWRKNLSLATFSEVIGTVRSLREKSFDIVLDFQGLIKSGVVSFLTGAKSRAGFSRKDCREKANALFTNRKARPFIKTGHVVDKNLSLLKKFQIEKFEIKFSLKSSPEAETSIRSFCDNNADFFQKPVAAVNPGVGFQTKQWALDRFAKIADRVFRELNLNILLTWGPGEKEKVEEIASQMKEKCLIAPPTTILESIALYQKLDLFIGGDTGPLHICAALDVPTVSIFGPTDPGRNGAYGPIHTTAFKKISCSFCYKRKCPTQNECLLELKEEEVFEAILKNNYNASVNPNSKKGII